MTIIDVRTPAEYSAGHVAGSTNIPLQEVPNRLDEFKAMAQPLVVCCASGVRSGNAVQFLKSHGIACENGGSWLDLNAQQ